MALTLDLTRFRDIADSALPDTATVSRPSRAADSSGGRTITWSTVGTYACRVAKGGRAANEAEGTRGLQVITDWKITFPAGTDVRPADRIVVGARTFEVKSGGAKSYEVARVVECQEIL